MSDHDCPGLRECLEHPRWHVFKYEHWWDVWTPRSQTFVPFHTHAEAIHHAQKEATK